MTANLAPAVLGFAVHEHRVRLLNDEFIRTRTSVDLISLKNLLTDSYIVDEKTLVIRHILRLCLESLFHAKKSLSSLFISLPSNKSIKSSEIDSKRLFNGDFSADFLSKTIAFLLTESSPRLRKIFFSFVDLINEKINQVQHNFIGRFLETLLSNELNLAGIEQLIIVCVLYDTCISQGVKPNLQHYLQTIYPQFLKRRDSKTWRLSSVFINWLLTFLFSPKMLEIFGDEATLMSFLRANDKEWMCGDFNWEHMLPSHSTDNGGKAITCSSATIYESLSASDYIDLDDKELDPILDSMSSQNLNFLAHQIREFGAKFTQSVETCEKYLSTLISESSSLNSVSIAKVAVMMMNTCSPVVDCGAVSDFILIGSVENSDNNLQPIPWNPKVFANAVKKMTGSFSSSEIVMHLDDPAFMVRNKVQLQFLTNFVLEFVGTGQFPVGLLYREWNFCKAGQFSWIEQIVKNSDVFCFADYPHRAVNTSMLKVQSEEGNRDLAPWRSLDLVELLLKLYEHKKLSSSVSALMRKPMSVIPDIMVLAIVQLMPSSVVDARWSYLEGLLPVLISNHPNAVPVLSTAWNADELNKPPFYIRNLILSSLFMYYDKSADDLPSKLNRILELAHELKPNGLADLCNWPQYPFCVDIAILASRRDFLKLDKWVEDKLAEQGDQFARHLISYIRQRFIYVNSIAANTIPQDTVQIILSSLSKATTISSNTISDLQQVFIQLRQIQTKDNRYSGMPIGSRSHVIATSAGSANAFGGIVPGGSSVQGTPAQQIHVRQQQQGLPVQLFNSVQSPNVLASPASGYPQQVDILKPSFGVGQAISMSPSGQLIRSLIGSSTSTTNRSTCGPTTGNWCLPSSVTATAALRTTPAPIVSNSVGSVDFRPQLTPNSGAAHMSNISGYGPNSIQHPSPLAVQSNAQQAIAAAEDYTRMNFSEEIQNEANMYFQQIYAQHNQMSVPEFIIRLKGFKDSMLQRDREVLACVVKNLFEEHRFFRDYPERELRTTAEVYGGIIREGIVTNVQFATAMRKVIQSLQSEENSLLWTFGVVSLNACKAKLFCYPKVCVLLTNSDFFASLPKSLKDYAQAGTLGKLPADIGCYDSAVQKTSPNTEQSGRPMAVRSGPSVLSVTNVDTLITAMEKDGVIIEQPPSELCEKVAFLFNNLSKANLHIKIQEMKQIIASSDSDFLKWLAQYLVSRRVSIEQNFQPLYKNFVESLADKTFEEHIKTETLRNIRILLKADKREAASNFGDRQLLKNLGLWLGIITVADDHPITIEELDLKSLLLEAYYKGQEELLFVVPFIAKVLSSCCRSKLFGPKSAWIQAIVRVLVELHNEPDLKLNLKFEIEVLFKEWNVSLMTTPVYGILKDTERLIRLPQQLGDLRVLKQPEIGPSPVAESKVVFEPVTDRNAFSSSCQEPGADITPANNHIALNFLAPSQQQRQPQPSATVVHHSMIAANNIAAHYNYQDISIVSYESISHHIKLLPSLPLFQVNPQMKNVVKPSIYHALREVMGPVIDKAMKVALSVSEIMCKKDFALDPNEKSLRQAAHHMVRAMAAAITSIMLRDPLRNTTLMFLKQAFTNQMPQLSNDQMKSIDEATVRLTDENIELATSFCIKTACEKAVPEIDKRLESEYMARKQAAINGKQYADPVAVARAQSLPGKLRPGPLNAMQLAVYDEFGSRICGFKAIAAPDTMEMSINMKPAANSQAVWQQVATTQDKESHDFGTLIQRLIASIDSMLANNTAQYRSTIAVASIRECLSQFALNPRDPNQFYNLNHRLVEQLLYAYRNPEALIQHQGSTPKAQGEIEWSIRLKDVFLQTCRCICSQISLHELARRITRILIECRIEYRFNIDAIEVLIKHTLLQLNAFDHFVSMQIECGNNLEAVMFAQRLAKMYIDAGNRQFLVENLPRTLDQLTKIQHLQRPTPSDSGAVSAAVVGSNRLVMDESDSRFVQELQSKAEYILREWIQMCYSPLTAREPQQVLTQIVHIMHEQGVLSTDEMVTKFFRICTEMCVDVSYRLLKSEHVANQSTIVRQRCYYTLDAFVKLACLMIKFSEASAHMQTKVNLLKKILNIVTTVLTLDHGARGIDFYAMPYHRIIIGMFNDLSQDQIMDSISWNILEAFGQALFVLQPRRVPAFAFSWLDIVGHRNFISKLLKDNADTLKTTAMYTQLLLSHLKFLAPFLRNIHLSKPITTLYRGTLRVLLVILHDFPELLCEYHWVVCDVIPPNCVQLRNLVLSAYPKNMRLPDPFVALKLENLHEMTEEPKMHVNMATIIPVDIRNQLDDHLNTRSSIDFISKLPDFLQTTPTTGCKYNTSLINAVVLYVGMRAIQTIQEKQQCMSMTTISHTACMDIFQSLSVSLCTEGRYLLFNAIANQLRYPNSHTHYFSCTILYLFLEANDQIIQEQITRILFERLVSFRPHPWGLLITFAELIKNPVYSFWKNKFVHCAPEIERLLQSIAQSCVGASSRNSSANFSHETTSATSIAEDSTAVNG